MMKYKAFRQLTEKKLDAWVEVVLFDPISTFLSYVLCMITTAKSMPYILTGLSFVLRMSAAFCIFSQNIVAGFILLLLGDISDGMDGKVSRFLFKKDPEKRGTLDFLLDHVSMSMLILAIGSILLRTNIDLAAWLLVYLVLYLLLSAFIGTKFRLYAKASHNPDVHLLEKQHPKGLLGMVYALQKKLMKFRLVFHPSSVDAEFFVFALFPISGFNPVFLMLGIVFVFIDLLTSGVGPVFLMLRK